MSAVGDLVQITGGQFVIRPPTHCPIGHQFRPGRVLVGHQPCGCGGHTTWRCTTCDTIIYAPVLADGCTALADPAAVRTI
ncbi:hypothetical protein [[Mycobacterium] crassicus]|uniref:Uncharacterized protein n=1 Tax=[Mycobacterium] crassicus TaxID=2872309 RepID=A0ABU5XGL6_9MYCO|nr:hypothetical protein [Mycolicibacter sp. MYC098]MEB3021331.1 hypothetical protein [Mycolicibacter sp. MYC098]